MEPETQELRVAILGIDPDELLEPQLRKNRLGGYTEEDVDDLLERCRLQLTSDEREITQLRETVQTLQQQPHGAHSSALGPATGLRILTRAQENADRVQAAARTQVDELLAEARKQAESILAQARDEAGTQAREALQAAQADADKIRAQAPRDAERRVARYMALADTIQTQLGALLGTWHDQGEAAAQETEAAGDGEQANGRAKRQRKPAGTAES
jgi:cell division septum initiation protein DivIVA